MIILRDSDMNIIDIIDPSKIVAICGYCGREINELRVYCCNECCKAAAKERKLRRKNNEHSNL